MRLGVRIGRDVLRQRGSDHENVAVGVLTANERPWPWPNGFSHRGSLAPLLKRLKNFGRRTRCSYAEYICFLYIPYSPTQCLCGFPRGRIPGVFCIDPPMTSPMVSSIEPRTNWGRSRGELGAKSRRSRAVHSRIIRGEWCCLSGNWWRVSGDSGRYLLPIRRHKALTRASILYRLDQKYCNFFFLRGACLLRGVFPGYPEVALRLRIS
jgi:hypothetical protein